MLALRGYFNGKEFITIDKADIKPNQKVIITVLDDFFNSYSKPERPFEKYIGKLSAESFVEINEALKETEKVDINEW